MCSWWVSKFPEPSITFILISSPIEYLSICFRRNFSIRVPKTIPKKCSVFALFGHWSNIIHFLRQQHRIAKTKPLLCFMRKIFTHKWVIKLYCVCQNAGSLWIVICILVVMRHTHTQIHTHVFAQESTRSREQPHRICTTTEKQSSWCGRYPGIYHHCLLYQVEQIAGLKINTFRLEICRNWFHTWFE